MKTNLTIIYGNIGGDIEVSLTSNGKRVVNFSLAESYANGKNDDNTTKYETRWHKVVAWENDATYMERYCQKGQPITVHGYLDYDIYEIAGKKIPTAKIVVDNVIPHAFFNHSAADKAKQSDRKIDDNNWQN